jgi:type I restriction-modification system DNA methylase subunit
MIDNNKIIHKTIQILDRYTKLYKEISKSRFNNYSDYMAGGHFGDEDELTKPKLWVDFIEEVLGFPKDEYIPEQSGKTGTPDFKPRDQRVHPFFFELKGTDTEDLSTRFSQVNQYLKPPLKWGVITNMRDLCVYTEGSPFPVPNYSFSFSLLYRDYKTNKDKILEFSNTKRFLEFVICFTYKKVSSQDKIEYLKKAPKWTQREVLDPDELIGSIRKVVGWLIDDARNYKSHLVESFKFDFDTRAKEAIALEIETIACELDRKRNPQDKTLEYYIKSKANTLEYRSFEILLSRVAYFTMTRILLARIWEDIEFIEQSLYDGGFKKWYEIRNRQIQMVLRDAFNMAGNKYSWLYNVHNNYTWYTPSEESLIDVLYELSKFNLGRLNADVLGTVYEEYVDKIDRKNKGQYYTPREIIKLIWDRVGFNNDDAYFRYENGKRTPRLIFDPATGSGGFLVEAARRIREESKYNDKDFDDLTELWLAIKEGLQGGEINLFAHYITEVNILIQLTPIIKKVMDAHKHQYKPPQFTLSVIPCDSLGLHLPYSQLINVNEVRDRKRDISLEILDPQKRDIYQLIKECQKYDYVCANPPYIGEKGHKELFRATLDRFPYWRKFYQGKMDYLYFFVILGLSKLIDGGKLGFITTSYWPTADGASNLRKYILDFALIKEIIDFGETKIFEGAPGQHNMIFVLEKCPSITKANTMVETPIKENIEKKEKNKIKIVKVKDIPALKGIKPLKKLIDHIEKHIDKKEYSDDFIDVFYSAVKQAELTEDAWNAILMRTNVDTITSKRNSVILKKVLEVRQGIVPGADRVTQVNIKYLPNDKIDKEKIKIGDGIFVLKTEEIDAMHLSKDEKDLVLPSYHNAHITTYFVDIPESEKDFLLYTDKNTDLKNYPLIKMHLEKFKEILEQKRETKEGKTPWYSLHWPRDKDLLSREKIVVSNWGTTWQPFAIQTGVFFEKRDITFFVKRNKIREELQYFLGILNSQLIKWWMIQKARQLGYMRQSIQEQIPILRIDFAKKDEINIHDTLVKKVDAMIETKKKLAEYNNFFVSRLTRLENSKDIPEIDTYAITKSLPASDLRVLRNHPKVEIKPVNIKEFYLHKISEVKDAKELFTKPTEEHPYLIKLTGKDKTQITIIAPKEIAYYLKDVLKDYIGKSWDEIKEIPLAKDLTTYETRKKEILTEVKKLLTKIENLQSEINDIIYELYNITQAERKIIEKELKK